MCTFTGRPHSGLIVPRLDTLPYVSSEHAYRIVQKFKIIWSRFLT